MSLIRRIVTILEAFAATDAGEGEGWVDAAVAEKEFEQSGAEFEDWCTACRGFKGSVKWVHGGELPDILLGKRGSLLYYRSARWVAVPQADTEAEAIAEAYEHIS